MDLIKNGIIFVILVCAACGAPAQVDTDLMGPRAMRGNPSSSAKGQTAPLAAAVLQADAGAAQDDANGGMAAAEADEDKAFTQTRPETKQADAIRITAAVAVAAPARTRRQVFYVRTKRKHNRKKLSTLHLIYGK